MVIYYFPDLWMMMIYFGNKTEHLRDWRTPVKPSWADQHSETCPSSLQRLKKKKWKHKMVLEHSTYIIEGSFKRHFRIWKRLETQNRLYIYPRYMSLQQLNTIRTIHTQYMNKQICTTEQQVSSPQRDPCPHPHCTLQARRTPGRALSEHWKLQILIREALKNCFLF